MCIHTARKTSKRRSRRYFARLGQDRSRIQRRMKEESLEICKVKKATVAEKPSSRTELKRTIEICEEASENAGGKALIGPNSAVEAALSHVLKSKRSQHIRGEKRQVCGVVSLQPRGDF